MNTALSTAFLLTFGFGVIALVSAYVSGNVESVSDVTTWIWELLGLS